jgi:uncharacterized protein YqgC (DUF456 family)
MKAPTRQGVKESRILRRAAGTILLVIGLAGLLLPILPGWLLIFVGLALLGVKLPYADRLLEYARSKLARKRVR